MRELIIREEAGDDIRAIVAWYERQRIGLGGDFFRCLEDCLTRIHRRPELFARVLGRVRRCKTRRFPFLVFYRETDDCVEVLAVLHASRHPRVWRRRVRKDR